MHNTNRNESHWYLQETTWMTTSVIHKGNVQLCFCFGNILPSLLRHDCKQKEWYSLEKSGAIGNDLNCLNLIYFRTTEMQVLTTYERSLCFGRDRGVSMILLWGEPGVFGGKHTCPTG